jgi:hypothetical protein
MSSKREMNENDKMLPFIFDLPDSSLLFIDNMDGLKLLEAELRDCVVVGIDTERKPSFLKASDMYKKRINPTSIIQLATRSSAGKEKVFIVDLLVMKDNAEYKSCIENMMKTLMLDENCYKIGQGLKQDFVELKQAYPDMKSFELVHSVIETATLQKKIDPQTVNTLSLKNLVKMYLHLNLVKTQQMSNWELRPLKPNQIHYAACDALVLLRLLDAMSCELEEIMLERDNETFEMKCVTETVNLSTPSNRQLKRNQFKAFGSPSSASRSPVPTLETLNTMTSPSSASTFSYQSSCTVTTLCDEIATKVTKDSYSTSLVRKENDGSCNKKQKLEKHENHKYLALYIEQTDI